MILRDVTCTLFDPNSSPVAATLKVLAPTPSEDVGARTGLQVEGVNIIFSNQFGISGILEIRISPLETFYSYFLVVIQHLTLQLFGERCSAVLL